LRFFVKAQLSAFVGIVVDYAVMIFFTAIVGFHFTLSIAIGGVIGAAVNFSINKIWTFQTKKSSYQFNLSQQLWRFICVLIISIVLKIIGTFGLTSLVLHFFEGETIFGYVIVESFIYKYCRLVIDILVFCFVNYKLQRHWVFRSMEAS
jgi:putative flippase GtrA